MARHLFGKIATPKVGTWGVRNLGQTRPLNARIFDVNWCFRRALCQESRFGGPEPGWPDPFSSGISQISFPARTAHREHHMSSTSKPCGPLPSRNSERPRSGLRAGHPRLLGRPTHPRRTQPRTAGRPLSRLGRRCLDHGGLGHRVGDCFPEFVGLLSRRARAMRTACTKLQRRCGLCRTRLVSLRRLWGSSRRSLGRSVLAAR